MCGSKKTIYQTTNQNTTQTNAPLAAQMPMYNWLWDTATGAAKNVQGKGYTGNFLAPMGQDFTGGLDFLRANAPSLGMGAAPTNQLAMDTVTGKYLSPDSNPFIAAAAQAAIRPVQNTVMRNLLPAVSDQAIAQGAYGGARQDIAQGQVLDEFARTAGDITAGMYAENYARERALQMQAPALFAQANELSRAPGIELLALGEAQQKADQILLDNARMQAEEQRKAQFYGLGELAQILSAGGFGTRTGTMTGTSVGTNPNYQPPEAQWAQGIIGGLGMLGSLFGAPVGGTSAAMGLANLFRR